jgi:nitrite reductase/ring-hydroxylating ferredoxin subunit
MAYKQAMELAVLQQENRRTISVDGHKILFIWHEGHVYAVQSQCPHLKLPLAKGKITEQCTIICPFHKSEFDLNTGKSTCWSPWPPVIGGILGKLSKETNLKTYPTKIDQGEIWVDINS